MNILEWLQNMILVGSMQNHSVVIEEPSNVSTVERLLIGRKRDVYIYTPMCASARIASSNIVYREYGYRSTGTSVLNTEIGL